MAPGPFGRGLEHVTHALDFPIEGFGADVTLTSQSRDYAWRLQKAPYLPIDLPRSEDRKCLVVLWAAQIVLIKTIQHANFTESQVLGPLLRQTRDVYGCKPSEGPTGMSSRLAMPEYAMNTSYQVTNLAFANKYLHGWIVKTQSIIFYIELSSYI